MSVARAVMVVIAMSASGCLIGFDAHRITGGGGNGGTPTSPGSGGTPMSPASGAPVGDMGGASTTLSCDDLAPYLPGAQLSDWVAGKGTWTVTMMAQGKVLVQTTSSTSYHDRFIAWRSGQSLGDVTINSVALLDGNPTDLNCVLARVVDGSNYYSLCVQDVGGRNRPPTRQWSLNSVVSGTETSLASATIPTAPSHVLSFKLQGTTLTATVDGDPKPPITDTSFAHGSVGVSTDNGGGFFNLCTRTP